MGGLTVLIVVGIILVVIETVISTIACTIIARKSGRNAVGWFFIGVFSGFIGLVIILCVTNKSGQFVMKKRTKQLLFCLAITILPMIQFAIMYVGVNFNSVLLAFQKRDTLTGQTTFIAFKNFEAVFKNLFTGSMLGRALLNSVICWALGLFVGTLLAIMFSYYLYKKFWGHRIFKVMLFLPSMISMAVFVLIFSYFVDAAIPDIFGIEGLLTKSEAIFPTILFFNIWISFGTNVIMYSNAMAGIDESIMEYARIEGVSPLKELFFIVVPIIYPTLQTFIVTGIAGIFIGQANLYLFYGSYADPQIMTIGYYLFTRVVGQSSSLSEYPYAAAMGIVFTLVAAPITLGVKKFMDKADPINGGGR